MPKKPGKRASVGGTSRKVTPVEATKHKDERINIPTHELRDFVKADLPRNIRALAGPCHYPS